MVKFLSKFQGRGIKIDGANSILVAKSMILVDTFCAITPWVTSSWIIVFFVLSLRLLPLVCIYFGHDVPGGDGVPRGSILIN